MQERQTILIVEDDTDISRLLRLEIEEAGFEVITCDTGVRGLSAIREEDPDLIVLDLGLPDFDGAEVARRVRKTSETPIIILTAKDDIATKVELLNAGADDYLTKPFHTEELLARVNVQLRHRTSDSVQKIGSMMIHPARRQAFWEDNELRLSPREFDLLSFLCSQPGRGGFGVIRTVRGIGYAVKA